MTPAAFAADPLAALGGLLHRAPDLAARLRPLPLWALALVAAAGLAVLLLGARRRRPLAAAGGAAVGWLAGMAVAGLLGLPGGLFPLLGAIVLCGASAAVPPLFPFAVGGLAGGLLGALLPVPGQGPLAAGIGIFLVGGVGVLAARILAAFAAGLAGAAAVGAALVGAARYWRALDAVVAHPAVLWGLVLVLAVAGAAYQSETAWGARGGSRRRGPPAAPAAAESA